jgi:hypothetical protein
MTSEEIIKAWNNQADKHNRWSDLGEDEMLELTRIVRLGDFTLESLA